MERNTCLIRQLRYNQKELSDPTRETIYKDWQGTAARIHCPHSYKHLDGFLLNSHTNVCHNHYKNDLERQLSLSEISDLNLREMWED